MSSPKSPAYTRRWTWQAALSLGTRCILSICLALISLAFGAALVWLSFEGVLGRMPVLGVLLTLFVVAFICLFGLGFAWQSLRGAPTHRSFFIRWLDGVGKRTDPSRVLIALLLLALCALGLGLATGSAANFTSGLKLLSAWLAFHLQVLLHEYGHWRAARACRYRPYRVVGGVISFRLLDGQWIVRANRDWAFLLGGAVFVQIPGAIRTRSRDFAFVAAGPFATALLWWVCSALQPMLSGVPALEEFAQLNANWAAILLVTNLIPIRASPTGLGSDGYQLLALLRERR